MQDNHACFGSAESGRALDLDNTIDARVNDPAEHLVLAP
jgi:hypothetical protein